MFITDIKDGKLTKEKFIQVYITSNVIYSTVF